MIAFNWRISLKALTFKSKFYTKVHEHKPSKVGSTQLFDESKTVLEGHFTAVTRVSGDGAHP